MSFLSLLQVLHGLSFIEVMTQHYKLFLYMLHVILLMQSFPIARNSNCISPLGSICFFLLISGFRYKTNKKETLLFDTRLFLCVLVLSVIFNLVQEKVIKYWPKLFMPSALKKCAFSYEVM